MSPFLQNATTQLVYTPNIICCLKIKYSYVGSIPVDQTMYLFSCNA